MFTVVKDNKKVSVKELRCNTIQYSDKKWSYQLEVINADDAIVETFNCPTVWDDREAAEKDSILSLKEMIAFFKDKSIELKVDFPSNV